MGNENSKTGEQTEDANVSEKHRNGSVGNGLSLNGGPEIDVKDSVVTQNSEPGTLDIATDSTECVVISSQPPPASCPVPSETPRPDPPTPPEVPEVSAAKEEVADTPDASNKKEEAPKKPQEKGRIFGKMFKKKAETAPEEKTVPEQQREAASQDQVDVGQPPVDPSPAEEPQQESEPLTEPVTEGTEPEGCAEAEVGNSVSEESPEDAHQEEPTVMNFFKSLVNNTKTSKKETATPDVAKDQSQKESQPAPTTTVAQVAEPPAPPKGMSIPPPPPPAPPKMEMKAEPAAKSVKAATKEEPKAAAKEPEASKGKSALSKFFRPKTIKEAPLPEAQLEVTPVVDVQEAPVEAPEPELAVQSEDKLDLKEALTEAPQTVETVEQVAEEVQQITEAEKADPPKAGTPEAAAKPEPPAPAQEEKKTAPKLVFKSLFKSKAASAKTASPTPPASPASAVAQAKPKEEAKSADSAADSKAAAAASPPGEDAAKGLKKVEKRNSIQGFFKNLVK